MSCCNKSRDRKILVRRTKSDLRFRYNRNLSLTGFTLVEIMIVAAILGVIAAIVIPNLIRARIATHDAAAKRDLHTLVAGIESYAATSGSYPANITELTKVIPPYINEDITLGIRKGYHITCSNMTTYSYTCTAIPQSCQRSGSKNYTVTTGNVWTETDCTP